MAHHNSKNNNNNVSSLVTKCFMDPVWLIPLLVMVLGTFNVSPVSGVIPTCPSSPANNTNINPLPNITGSYTAFMEWWDASTNSFYFRQEYVDQESNMAAIRIYGLYDPGDVYVFITDYNAREIFTMSQNEQGKRCSVAPLKSYDTESFPAILVSNKTQEHIAATHTLLNFGKEFNERYEGTNHRIRGKATDMWRGCYFDKDTGRTVVSNYFFSVPDWYPSSTKTVVPMQSRVTSYFQAPGASQDIHQTIQIDYVFFSYDVIDKTIFQTTNGMYCEGRKPTTTKPVPKFPDVFQFQSQRVLHGRQEIGIYNEMYDLPAKLVKIESTSPSTIGMGDGLDRISISDFNSGVSYLISSTTGHCDIAPITPDDFNTRLVDSGHIRIATAKEFGRFDSGSFVYSGQVKTQGVDCDTWTGQTTNYPEGFNGTSYWTWHFNTVDWSIKSSTQPQVPLYLDIKIIKPPLEMQFSIHDFRTSKPDWENEDISQCYQRTETRKLGFSLVGKLGVALSRPKLFKKQIVQKISDVMKVSVLRISRFQSNLDAAPPSLTFALLDLPGIKGDVVTEGAIPTIAATTLDQAVQRLNDTIKSGLVFLRFYVRNPQNKEEVVSIFAAPDSLRQKIQYPNGTLVESPPRSLERSTTTTIETTQTTLSTTPPSTTPRATTPPSTATTPPPTAATTTRVAAPATSSSSSSSPPVSPSTSSKSSLHDATSKHTTTQAVLGGVTRAQKTGLCNDDPKDSSVWSSKSIAGLGFGMAMLGLLIGGIGTVLVLGRGRWSLWFKSRKQDGDAYRMM